LFGDMDTVINHRDSILINISHVPEVSDQTFPNDLKGICNVLGEKSELITLLDRVVICVAMNRTFVAGSIALLDFSNKIKSLQPIRHPGKIFRTAMSEATANALVLFANEAKDEILDEITNHRNFKAAYRKLNYLLQLGALKDKGLDEKIVEIKRGVKHQL